ncbi:MAG: hypothetical protein FJ091_19930 [Deltaproteobacteria bacterium]|nr:hypothetical protein [Deltaproteobacteria bacterium]
MQPQIHPRWGIGRVRLGMTRDEARARAGEPDRIEEDDELAGVRFGWHYERFGFSLYFDADLGGRLTLVVCEAESTSVRGVRPIGMREAEAKRALAPIGALALDEEASDDALRFHRIEDAGLGLLFADGVCESVDLSVSLQGDGELSWPNGDAPE